MKSSGLNMITWGLRAKMLQESKEIPWKWKFVLSLGMKLGMVKLIEVGF